MTGNKPFIVEYFSQVRKVWVPFQECDTRPEAEMFKGHYCKYHSTHRWRIREVAA